MISKLMIGSFVSSFVRFFTFSLALALALALAEIEIWEHMMVMVVVVILWGQRGREGSRKTHTPTRYSEELR
jgi:hypothetical protein